MDRRERIFEMAKEIFIKESIKEGGGTPKLDPSLVNATEQQDNIKISMRSAIERAKQFADMFDTILPEGHGIKSD